MPTFPRRSQLYQRLWTFYLLYYQEKADGALRDVLSNFLPRMACIYLNLLCDEVETNRFPGWYCHPYLINPDGEPCRLISSSIRPKTNEKYNIRFGNVLAEISFLCNEVQEGRISLQELLYERPRIIKEKRYFLAHLSFIAIVCLFDIFFLNFLVIEVLLTIMLMVTVRIISVVALDIRIFTEFFADFPVITKRANFSSILQNITTIKSSLLEIDSFENFDNDSSLHEKILVTSFNFSLYILLSRPVITLVCIFVFYEYYKIRKMDNKMEEKKGWMG